MKSKDLRLFLFKKYERKMHSSQKKKPQGTVTSVLCHPRRHCAEQALVASVCEKLVSVTCCVGLRRSQLPTLLGSLTTTLPERVTQDSPAGYEHPGNGHRATRMPEMGHHSWPLSCISATGCLTNSGVSPSE